MGLRCAYLSSCAVGTDVKLMNPALSLPTEEPTMKGIGFENVRLYVHERFGEGAWQTVMSRLSPTEREEVEHAIAVGWYKVSCFAALLRAVDRVCGTGNLALMREIGAFEAEQDMNRAIRVFLRVLNPNQLLKVEARIWRHFQSHGEWTTKKVAGGVEAELSGWFADEASCEELAGYLVRLVEFTGGKSVRMKHRVCRAKGHGRCVFEYRYQ